MEIREVAETEYQQVYDLRDYAFRHAYTGKKLIDFKFWVKNSCVLGGFEEGQLAGQLIILPLNMQINQQSMSMGGLGFVATYPEHRGKGVMKKLIITALEKMRENGQSISILGPFSVAFYRHFGWELFFDKVAYSVDKGRYPAVQLTESLEISRTPFDQVDTSVTGELPSFYNQMMQDKFGSMLRTPDWWQRLKNRESHDTVTLFKRNNRIVGYLRYVIEDVVLTIHDYIATDADAEKALWHYLTSHSSNVFEIRGESGLKQHFNFAFNDPQVKQNLVQDCMIRIVDVIQFMNKYRFNIKAGESLYLDVEDEFAPWNTGVYKISADTIEKLEQPNNLDMDQVLKLPINLLSSFLMGYLTIQECLYQVEQPINDEASEKWAQAVGNKTTEFYEHF